VAGAKHNWEKQTMTFRSVLGLAGLALAAVAAAQSAHIQTAKVPFAFNAGGATMPAGNYEITLETAKSTPTVRIYNWETGQGAMMLAPGRVAPDKSLNGNYARLVFLCAGTDCALSEVQPGRGENGYKAMTPKFLKELGSNRVGGPEVARVVVPIKSAD
jgi:hypothetical protein